MKSHWQIFDTEELLKLVHANNLRLHELISRPTMSLVVFHFPIGSKDMQSPHEEDEAYVVLEGKGRLKIESDEYEVKPGKILFVKRGTRHSFFDIEEDLTVLALFGSRHHGLPR